MPPLGLLQLAATHHLTYGAKARGGWPHFYGNNMSENLGAAPASSPLPRRLLARSVARALLRRLEKAGTSVHWVNVVGESSIDSAPKMHWPDTEPMLNILVQDGFSEGSLVYVMAQADRRKPENQVPLLLVKMLRSKKRVGEELHEIFEFFDNFESNTATCLVDN